MDSVESLVHLSLREEERKTKKETHLQVDHIERTNEFIKLPDSKTCQPHVNVQYFFFCPGTLILVNLMRLQISSTPVSVCANRGGMGKYKNKNKQNRV